MLELCEVFCELKLSDELCALVVVSSDVFLPEVFPLLPLLELLEPLELLELLEPLELLELLELLEPPELLELLEALELLELLDDELVVVLLVLAAFDRLALSFARACC